MTKPERGIAVAVLLALSVTAGCIPYGGSRLEGDQVDYSRALNVAQKQQTLTNIVSLRYADPPMFVPVTQIISAHSMNGSATATLTGNTISTAGNSAQLGGTLGFSSTPTFTFTPTTGEDFAQGYIRPLSPVLVLPLMQSGVPVDLLLRIAVQSVGNLQNSAVLSGANNSGSVGFFELIHVLRRLQLRGVLTMRLQNADGGDRVFLAIDPSRLRDATVANDAARARKLLGVADSAKEIEIVYGAVPEHGAKVGIITRSIIGILTELGAQIDVPQSEVDNHTTLQTVHLLTVEPRPTIIIHVGPRPPERTYADVAYDANHYWIAWDDFDSKFAFSVVEQLIALAQSGQGSKTPIITIPAG